MTSVPLNIVQITTHDTGRYFGCYGHPTLHTPAIDRFAADGVRLADLFCAVPICSPSRTTMLTGLYPQQHGQLDLTGFGWKMRDPALHMSRRLRAAGYRTALFGIQHEVLSDELGTLSFDITWPERRASAVDVADQVASFLNGPRSKEKPFYLQIGFRETHTPFEMNGTHPDTERGVEVPPYLADDEGNRHRMAAFQGAVRLADEGIGRILQALRASGLEENTLVVITTDHGIEMPRAKWHLYDPGIAIAMILRCPALGLTGGRTLDSLLSNVDYLPTVLDLLGVVSDGMAGRSFADALLGRGAAGDRDAVFAMFGKRSQPRCIRTKRYKLIRHFDAAAANRPPVAFGTEMQMSTCKPVELFDLEADPNEFQNRSDHDDYQQVRRELDDRLWRWMESVDDPLLAGPVASPSYQAALRDYHRGQISPEDTPSTQRAVPDRRPAVNVLSQNQIERSE